MTRPPSQNPSARRLTAVTDVTTGKRINLLDWRAANVRYSIYLGLFMVALLVAIGYTAALALGAEAAWLYMVLAGGLALAQNAAAYWYGDQACAACCKCAPSHERRAPLLGQYY